MLEVEQVTITELKKYIEIAFEGDEEFFKYYDKCVLVNSYSDISNHNYFLLKEYAELGLKNFSYKVTLNNIPIGFIFITKNPNLLVSFSISKNYRNKKNLIEFFDKIKNIFSQSFDCFLYKENERAINWLIKCGMQIELTDGKIVKLKN
jgi:hypothetical protein